jgi:Cupin
MTADALSDVLKTVRLTGATFFEVVAKTPWVAESPRRDLILPRVLPGAEHLIAYHVLTEGSCFANIIDQEPVMIEAGEVIVFTRCDPHVLSSSPGMRADPASAAALDAATQLPFAVSLGEHPYREGAIRLNHPRRDLV